MEKKQREKLCPNCDGEMDIDVIVCPYCGFDMTKENRSYNPVTAAEYASERKIDKDDPISSLYPPPYQPKVYASETEGVEDEVAEGIFDDSEMEEATSQTGKFFLPTILFSVGINLCFLALFMILFSHDGELFLRWNSRLWVLFFLTSLPMLFFGYRGLFKRK